jgi:hypothetical protein
MKANRLKGVDGRRVAEGVQGLHHGNVLGVPLGVDGEVEDEASLDALASGLRRILNV